LRKLEAKQHCAREDAMNEGPSFPAKKEDDVFTLADGRKIDLESIQVSQTFMGFLEGSPQASSAVIRERIRETAKIIGWQVIDTHGDVLPRFTCVAKLQSFQPVRSGDWDYSTLDVMWFLESIDINLRDLITKLLRHVDWDNRAFNHSREDY
jgi:hypothetical protein